MLNRKKKKIFFMKRKNLLRYQCKIKSSHKNRRLINFLKINVESKRDIKYLLID